MIFKLLLLSTVAIWTAVFTVPSSQVRLIICDVGQGDAILVTKGTFQFLVDGGSDNKVLDCLAKYVPFYDRRIEVVLLTHPDADHVTGLAEVFTRYEVSKLIRLTVPKDTQVYKRFLQASAQTPIVEVFAGESVRLGETELNFDIIWPTKSYYDGVIKNNPEVNLLSIVGNLRYGDTEVLLTGDVDSQVDLALRSTRLLKDIEILKVPHHGSKKGFTLEWLDIVKPELAIISVGSKNRYGHPGQNILDLFSKRNIPVLRTDQVGDIVLTITKSSYKIEN